MADNSKNLIKSELSPEEQFEIKINHSVATHLDRICPTCFPPQVQSPERVRIPPSSLSQQENMLFRDTSFFASQGIQCNTLPTSAQVLEAANGDTSHENRPPPVRFLELNLLVKYGRDITIAEGQCLWAMRHFLHRAVPVPEVYGWCREGSQVFIYMELVKGTTLKDRWKDLDEYEKSGIREQLGEIVTTLRLLEQDLDDKFVGHISRQPLLDIIFINSCSPTAGHSWALTRFMTGYHGCRD